MKRFMLLLAITPIVSAAQTEETALPESIRHYRMTADFAPGMQLQRYFQYGADLQLTYTTKKWAFNAQSFATPFETLDPQRDQLNQLFTNGTNDGVKALASNQSSLTAIRNIFTGQAQKGSGDRTTKIGIRGGYFYSQQSLYASLDYLWVADANGGYICTSGWRAHSAALGADFVFERSSDRSTKRHHFYADVLCGFAMQMVGFGHTPEPGNPYYFTSKGHYYAADVPNSGSYARDRIGTRFGYEFRMYGRKRLGMYAGFEGQWRPGIDYHYNPMRYVPRGGEKLVPSVGTVKVGLTYRFLKTEI
jgi:hypothetical protein